MMFLAKGSHLQQIRNLLKRGANVNLADKNRETAVFYCLDDKECFVDKLDLFIEYGLNLNTLNVNKVG